MSDTLDAPPPDLVPVYDNNGQWIGYERPPGWQPDPKAQGTGAVAPPAPDAKSDEQPPSPKEAGSAPDETPTITVSAKPPEEPLPAAKVKSGQAAAAQPLHTAAGLVEKPDGTFGLPDAQPIEPQTPGEPKHLGEAAGLVEGPDGTWMTPEAAAAAAKAAPPPATTAKPGETPDAIPASEKNRSMGNQSRWQPVQDAMDWAGNVGASVRHGATLGMDEVVGPIGPALGRVMWEGIPFTQAYEEEKEKMRGGRHVFETQNPKTAAVAEAAGGVAPALVASPLYGATRAGAGVGARLLTTGRNVAANIGQGAVTAAGMTEGNLATRAKAAAAGAVGGAVMSPLPYAAGKLARGFTPGRQVERVAGETLLKDQPGGVAPIAPPAEAPIRDFPLGVGGSSGDPALAALERQARQLNDTKATAQRTDQNAAIREAATQKEVRAPDPTKPNKLVSTQLASGEMTPPEASARVVQAMQDANGILKEEETRLWSKPTIAQKPLDLPALKQRVDKAIGGMAARFRSVIDRTPDLRAALDDLMNMPADAKLADINAIRSELLGMKRALPPTEGLAKKVAGDVADEMLKAIESNPALRSDPQAWADYVKARAFTARKWDVLGQDAFQRMLLANKYGNAGVDPRTAAGSIFGFGRTGGERGGEGSYNAIGSMLDDVKRQWSALHAAGLGTPGTFNPTVAQAAKADLAQGARDFITNTMLTTATSNVRDASGQMGFTLNSLSRWIDDNKSWVQKSKIFNPDQMDLLQRIGTAAEMGARPDNLRGGKNSATFELMMREHRIIDLLHNKWTRGAFTLIGTGAGFGIGPGFETALGLGLGLGVHQIADAIGQKVYGPAAAKLKDLLTEAVFNPKIAADLMMKATAGNAGRLSQDTKTWLRAMLQQQPAAQINRIETEPAPAGTSPPPPPRVIQPPGPPVAAR